MDVNTSGVRFPLRRTYQPGNSRLSSNLGQGRPGCNDKIVGAPNRDRQPNPIFGAKKMVSVFLRQAQQGILLPVFLLFLTTSTVIAAPSGETVKRVPIKVVGEIEIFVVDKRDGRKAEVQYFVKQKKTNKRYRLKLKTGLPEGIAPGSRIRVKGKASGNTIFAPVLESGSIEPQITNGAIAAPAISGEQRTIVLTANFDDKPLSCSVDAIDQLMFSDPDNQSVADYYLDASHGNAWLSGETRGTYTIASPNDCSAPFSAYTNAIDAEATADGVDLSLYDRHVYVMPSNGCGYAGVGSVGNTPSQSLIFTCSIADVYAHELGHNFGMFHASTANNEYGDKTGIMGVSNVGLRHLNAAHQNELGWRSPAMNQLVTESGIYDLAPQSLQEQQAVAPQILRISKPDSDEYYFVAFRSPLGFDRNLEWWHHNIVTVHRYRGAGETPSNTFLVGELEPGQSFSDSANSISITHLSHTTDYASINISMGDGPLPECTVGTPSINLSPANQSGTAGQTLSYSVSVTNNDSASCASSSFQIDESVPAAWASSMTNAVLDLAPGQSGAATLNVASDASAAAASYPIGVAIGGASANATYTVNAECVASTPTLLLTPSSQSGDPGVTRQYNLSIVNNDSAVCGPSTLAVESTVPNGWSSSTSRQSMTLLPGESISVALNVTAPSSAGSGTYGIGMGVSGLVSQHNRMTSGSFTVNETLPANDTEAPSAPTGLTASSNHKQVSLSWNTSTDNVAVAGYSVYRDSILIASPGTSNYNDTSGAEGVTYSYTIVAVDTSGNISTSSSPLTAGKAVKGGGKTGDDTTNGGGGGNGGNNGKGPNK